MKSYPQGRSRPAAGAMPGLNQRVQGHRVVLDTGVQALALAGVPPAPAPAAGAGLATVTRCSSWRRPGLASISGCKGTGLCWTPGAGACTGRGATSTSSWRRPGHSHQVQQLVQATATGQVLACRALAARPGMGATGKPFCAQFHQHARTFNKASPALASMGWAAGRSVPANSPLRARRDKGTPLHITAANQQGKGLGKALAQEERSKKK